MFLEYIRLIGSGIQPEFSVDYILPIALIFLVVVAIVYIGYKIKEEIGAIVAILICVIFFLYLNDLLRVFY